MTVGKKPQSFSRLLSLMRKREIERRIDIASFAGNGSFTEPVQFVKAIDIAELCIALVVEIILVKLNDAVDGVAGIHFIVDRQARIGAKAGIAIIVFGVEIIAGVGINILTF